MRSVIPLLLSEEVSRTCHLAFVRLCRNCQTSFLNVSFFVLSLPHYDLPLSMCSFKSVRSISLCLFLSLSALALTVCVSVSLLSPCLCVCRPSLVLPVSVRPSSISGQPVSAPTTPTAPGSSAYATLFPTSLTVHSFVSLHQYCCPSTDQSLQQEDR